MKTTYARADKRQTRSQVLGYGLSIGMTTALFVAVPFANMLSVPPDDTGVDSSEQITLPPPPAPPVEPPKPPEPEEKIEDPEFVPDEERIPLIPTDNIIEVGNSGIPWGRILRPVDVGPVIEEYLVDQLDKAPVPIQRVAPTYPYEAKVSGLQGWVEVEFVVDTEGTVRNARIKRSSHREFESAALDAVRLWRFEPGMKDGRAVRTRMILPLRFNLNR